MHELAIALFAIRHPDTLNHTLSYISKYRNREQLDPWVKTKRDIKADSDGVAAEDEPKVPSRGRTDG